MLKEQGKIIHPFPAEMIDFSDKHPKYKSIRPLRHPRYYAYAVLLPDQSVLVLGGKTGTKGHSHTQIHTQMSTKLDISTFKDIKDNHTLKHVSETFGEMPT